MWNDMKHEMWNDSWKDPGVVTRDSSLRGQVWYILKTQVHVAPIKNTSAIEDEEEEETVEEELSMLLEVTGFNPKNG